MAKNKQQRGKASKSPAAPDKSERVTTPFTSDPSDPLRTFPPDPPQRNLALLIISAVLFAVWFCFLAYVALRG